MIATIQVTYNDIVSTLAFAATLFMSIWTVCTWIYQKKQKESLLLKVCIKRVLIDQGKDIPRILCPTGENYLSIQNIGIRGITILDCQIDNISIVELKNDVSKPHDVIGAKLEPYNSIRCDLFRGHKKVRNGDRIKLICRSESGKTIEKEYTLCEEQE